ncbi:allophanate hydrolase [Liquorilactobacillus mali]|uniref:Allophanate hydrolase n=1 Tax=Liquorilactobacillus mali TaxID=1618 RepID=A0A0R2FPB5_9LACO|nr:allophanate hydrolase [Liquorilactobacillus mali]
MLKVIAYKYDFVPAGEQALHIAFPEQIDVSENQLIQELAQQLQSRFIYEITDIVPAYRTLTISFDIRKTTYYEFSSKLKVFLTHYVPDTKNDHGRIFEVPVCYDPEFGIDLEDVAAFGNISVEELIKLHSANNYFIYMMGFLPGFAFMGNVPDRIAMPRLSAPRASIAPGSVAIAGKQAGMYPVDSPGGWRILGRTPITLYTPNNPLPPFQAGDWIKFSQIDRTDYSAIKELDAHGEYQLKIISE